ncbi:MAG: hypothetical protein KF724_09975 [Phycisphaeraceae bacterium]|nr:hypothetical protein [Phycisphaeraceae bacterium]
MFFKFKKSESGGSASKGFQPQPDKARKFLEHAETQANSSSYDYALLLFAQGIRLDPANMVAHQHMYEAAVRYVTGGGRAASSKDLRQIDDGTAVGRFAAAEFAWMKDLNNAQGALRMLERGVGVAEIGVDLSEFGSWAAPKVLNLVRVQLKKKPNKSLLIQAKNAFEGVNAWDEAMICAEEAYRLDPSDSKLMDEIKQLTAQRAIQQGGYQQNANQEGGFRANIRDADKQRALEEAESLSGNADIESRNLERAKKEFEENPLSLEAIRRYAQLLKRQQTPEAELKAIEVYEAGFARTSDFALRAAANDIRLTHMRREVKALEESASANPADAASTEAAAAARRRLLETELADYTDRIAKYPTDRKLRAEAGRVALELGKIEDAMAFFQAAKEEPRLRVYGAQMLGRCFAAEGWHNEAIGEFREAISAIDATTSELELDIRYDLMTSLAAQAKQEKSIALAKEAVEICSVIMRRDISFRDIRAKRKEFDGLLKDLS